MQMTHGKLYKQSLGSTPDQLSCNASSGGKGFVLSLQVWMRLLKTRTRPGFSPNFFPQAEKVQGPLRSHSGGFITFQVGGGILGRFGILFIGCLGPGCHVFRYPPRRLQVPILRLQKVSVRHILEGRFSVG